MYSKSSNDREWTYDSVKDAVEKAKGDWEGKKRLLSGKPQKYFHDIICTLEAHSGLFEIIPSSNTYVSVLTGAVKTLVKVSVNQIGLTFICPNVPPSLTEELTLTFLGVTKSPQYG